MKREILCPECAREVRRLYPTDNPYPGEGVRFVVGNALADCNCDRCNADIKTTGACVAFSIFTTDGRIPYFAWEHNFVLPVTENEIERGL